MCVSLSFKRMSLKRFFEGTQYMHYGWEFFYYYELPLEAPFTVNSEIFVRILFSRKALKDIFATSVNDRVISPFHKGFIFKKLSICEVSRK